jgi:hypothetical protein
MNTPAEPFVVNRKVSFALSDEAVSGEYTGLVKKTKENLVAMIVSNKDKNAIAPAKGDHLYFPFDKAGERWMSVAVVVQNASYPLLLLHYQETWPVIHFGEDSDVSPFGIDRDGGAHLGDVESAYDEPGLAADDGEADDDVVVAPVDERSGMLLEEADELTDAELGDAEPSVDVGPSADETVDIEPPLPMADPLVDMPEVDDAELSAELEADLSEAMAAVAYRMDGVDDEELAFEDDLEAMELGEDRSVEMGDVDEVDLTVTTPVDEVATPVDEEAAAQLVTMIGPDADAGMIGDPPSPAPVAGSVFEEPEVSEATRFNPPPLTGLEPTAMEFFPISVDTGAGIDGGARRLDPAVAAMIDAMQRRIARLERSMSDTPPPIGPNGFCLALEETSMRVALPSGADMAAGDVVSFSVDHLWRDRLAFAGTGVVETAYAKNGVTVVAFSFAPTPEGSASIRAYREGVADWLQLLSGLVVG